MPRYEYEGVLYTISELANMSGVQEATIRWRLRNGYSMEEALKIKPTQNSVNEFVESSWWEDWIGMTTSDLHGIYWKWCIDNGYKPVSKQTFGRQLLQLFPNLKTVPSRLKCGTGRIIRER